MITSCDSQRRTDWNYYQKLFENNNSKNDPRFLPIAAFVTNDVIVTLDMISNDVKIRTSWAAHLGGAFAE